MIKVNQFNDIAKNTLDEWIYFLKNEEIKENFKAKGLSEAKDKLDMLKLSEIDRQNYNRYLEGLTYQASMTEVPFLDGKQSGIEEGRVEGRIEGEKIGIEKGRLEGEKVGIEKGRMEGEKSGLEKVAISLSKQQMPVERIAEITNLTVSEIETLITKH